MKLDAAAGATLAWLPQETILFDRARVSALASTSTSTEMRRCCSLPKVVVFGRSAMGETDRAGRVRSTAGGVRRGGKLIFAETVRLDGAIARNSPSLRSRTGGVAIGDRAGRARR